MINHMYIPPKLGKLVNVIWEQKADTPSNWQILPSGFVELIFNIGPTAHKVKGKLIGDAFNPTENFCFLSGLHTRPLYMSFTDFHTIGIQMHPLAVKAIFGVPCFEVRDWAIPGDEILKDLSEIEDQLRSECDFMTKAQWLENYLLGKIRETSELHMAFRIKETVKKAKNQLLSGQRAKIESLTGYSRMHTHKLFTEWFGLAPAQTMRLHQFKEALNLFHEAPRRLTDIGLESGFYDQAHFIRIFREFAAMSPGDYRKMMSPLVGQLPF